MKYSKTGFNLLIKEIHLVKVKTVEDAQRLLTTAMHSEVYESVGLNVNDNKRWINECAHGWESGSRYTFAVTRTETVGGVWLQVTSDCAEAQVGYWIARSMWGHGFATESVGQLICYAENVLGIGRLMALIKSGNIGSCRVAVKCGFKAVTRTRHWNISQQKEEEVNLFIRGARG